MKMPFPNNPSSQKEIIKPESYKEWKSSKFIQVELIIHDDITRIFKDKDFPDFTFFKIKPFLSFLDQMNYVKPMIKAKKNSTFNLETKNVMRFDFAERNSFYPQENIKKRYKEFLDEELFFYHPFQLIDLSQKYIDYHNTQKFKIYNSLYQLVFEENVVNSDQFEKYFDHVKGRLIHSSSNKDKEFIESCGNPQEILDSFDKLHLMGQMGREIFSDALLCLTIKLSKTFPILYLNEYCSHKFLWTDSYFHFDLNDEDKQKIEEYNKWIKEQLMGDYLSEKEKKILLSQFGKDYYRRRFLEFNFHTEGLENLSDIFYVMNPNKLSDFKGSLWLKLTAIKFERNIRKIQWIILKKNLEYQNKKPYYFVEEKNYEEYRLAVLNEYELLPENYYILWVEGKTEKSILEIYLKFGTILKRSFPIAIRQIKHVDGIKNWAPIVNREFPHSYLFFDYDNDIVFKKRTKGLDKGIYSFFKPDFITCNFTADEIISAYKKFLEILEIQNSEKDEKSLQILLEENKQYENSVKNHFKERYYDLDDKRNELCKRIQNDENLKEYRKFITQREYDGSYEIKDISHRGKFNKNMTDFIKKGISDQICLHLTKVFQERRKEGKKNESEKYPFEKEFNKFYKIMRNQREKNRDSVMKTYNPNYHRDGKR